MQRLGCLLDQRHPADFGPRSEPQLNDIIAPVAAVADKSLEDRRAAARPSCHEASRVQRPACPTRCQMDDLNRPIESDCRRDVEDKAVAEECGIKRSKRPLSVKQRCFDSRTN